MFVSLSKYRRAITRAEVAEDRAATAGHLLDIERRRGDRLEDELKAVRASHQPRDPKTGRMVPRAGQ